MLRPYKWNCVHRGENGIDFGAQWRERANRIGGRGVSCEKQGLAAATAKVLLAAITAPARFLHPFFTTKFLKGVGIFPDFAQAARLHVSKFQAGNNLGCVAGKRVTAWRDENKFTAPATHAGFGKFRVVIRNDRFDANFAFASFLGLLDEFQGAVELFARGQQVLAIREGPAVILDVGKLDASGAGGFGDGQHFRDLADVAAVDDEIERDGDAKVFQPA